MKKHSIVLLILTLIGAMPVSAQIITGFGTSQFNPVNLANDLQGAWTEGGIGSQNSATISITGATNDFDGSSGIFSDLTQFSRSSVSITGNTSQLTLTGTLNSAPPGTNQFAIVLYDISGNSVGYNFNWSSFTGSNPVSVTANLAATDGSFDGTATAWGLNLFGPGGDSPATVSFTFDQILAGAVPEPSTYAMLVLGLGLLGFCFQRHQKVSDCT